MSALGVDAVNCADDEAGNAGDAGSQQAEARAVRTAGAITVAVSALVSTQQMAPTVQPATSQLPTARSTMCGCVRQ